MRGSLMATVAALVVAAGGGGEAAEAPAPRADGRELRFLRDGEEIRRLDLEALVEAGGVETVTVEDPYYETRKTFRAIPLGKVVGAGFGEPLRSLRGRELLFRALDGYVKPAALETIEEGGGYLAFADADHAAGADPGWQPIDRRQVDPGPFYVVWTGEGRNDPHRYPWPYQLAAIEAVSFESRYPHTVPAGLAREAAAWRGYDLFRRECFSCHSINGEGGTVGPELNVPRSIVEYRPVDQLKDFIRDPRSFRHTSMPAHPHLSDADLDALVAYFDAMKSRKHDPGAR